MEDVVIRMNQSLQNVFEGGRLMTGQGRGGVDVDLEVKAAEEKED